jgi:hypothetical protein
MTWKLHHDHRAEIIEGTENIDLSISKHGLTIQFFSDKIIPSPEVTINFNDALKLYKWLSWLENDGMFCEEGWEDDE